MFEKKKQQRVLLVKDKFILADAANKRKQNLIVGERGTLRAIRLMG